MLHCCRTFSSENIIPTTLTIPHPLTTPIRDTQVCMTLVMTPSRAKSLFTNKEATTQTSSTLILQSELQKNLQRLQKVSKFLLRRVRWSQSL